MYRLDVYVPASHADTVKTALFSAGAGRIGRYDCCCFQVSGIGRFRPLAGSTPFLGQAGEIESVPEIKLELLCPDHQMPAILAALKAAHPYETPAFQYWEVQTEYAIRTKPESSQ